MLSLNLASRSALRCVSAGRAGLTPVLGLLAGLAYLVLWIVYWAKIAEYSRMLDRVPTQGQWQSPAI